jgi:hypothetical protein
VILILQIAAGVFIGGAALGLAFLFVAYLIDENTGGVPSRKRDRD